MRRVATAWAGLRALRPVRRSEAGLSMHAFACPVTLPPGLNAPMPFAALALLLAHAHRFHGHAPLFSLSLGAGRKACGTQGATGINACKMQSLWRINK